MRFIALPLCVNCAIGAYNLHKIDYLSTCNEIHDQLLAALVPEKSQAQT